MIPLMLSQLATRLSGQLVGDDIQIEAVSSDSRNTPGNCLFVALKGERFDGHAYAESAIENGAVALLVERKLAVNIPQLIVNNSQKAMGEIGAYVREIVAPNCVALTGSNGKTSVKEMVATILSQHHQVLYTAGNFNNEIGVPLTLLRLEKQHQYGVFELGANHRGEIDYTSALVKPSVALVNNVASAHLEGFGSLAGVAQAKSEIFNHLAGDGIAIINGDDAFAPVMQQAASGHKQLRFSTKGEADVVATQQRADAFGRWSFQITYLDEAKSLSLPLAGRHQISNALAATSICLALGLSLDEIVAGLEKLQPVKGRMLPIGLGRVHVIDDSYNANPASVAAAIDWLQEIEGNSCLVLGDLGELGDNAALLHRQIGLDAKKQKIQALFCTGELTKNTSAAYGVKHHDDIKQLEQELIHHIQQLSGEITVLIKGSRSAKMERVIETLTTAYGRGEFVSC